MPGLEAIAYDHELEALRDARRRRRWRARWRGACVPHMLLATGPTGLALVCVASLAGRGVVYSVYTV